MAPSARIIVLCCAFVQTLSFLANPRQYPQLSRLQAGKGWDNSNFLDSLGGSDDDIQQANENYQSFSESRKAFLKRQQEYAKTEAGKRALEHQQKFFEQRGKAPSFPESDESLDAVDPAGRNGRSRFATMMNQAQGREQGFIEQNFLKGGFEQKLAIPLDEDGEESEDTESDDTDLLF